MLDPDQPRELVEVYGDGRRVPAALTHVDAVAYARAAANEFGIGENRAVDFDKERAKKDLAGDGDNEKKARKAKRGAGE